MDYLDFIEEYKDENMNLFEKVLLTIKRTRDIYNGKATVFNNKKKYRPLDCAIYEINKEYIQPKFEEISNKNLENFDIKDTALDIENDSLKLDNEEANSLKTNENNSQEVDDEKLVSQLKVNLDDKE